MEVVFFFQAEDGIRDGHVTGVQTCALPILRLSGEAVALLRRLPWRWLRQLVLPWLRQGALVIEELFVSMTALKSAEAVQQWRLTHAPNVLATNYVCWQHHWEGRP